MNRAAYIFIHGMNVIQRFLSANIQDLFIAVNKIIRLLGDKVDLIILDYTQPSIPQNFLLILLSVSTKIYLHLSDKKIFFFQISTYCFPII
jgi:hypothetical protein